MAIVFCHSLFSVIHSVGSKLLRNISLSDLSFLFMVYSTITAYCAVFDYNILFINKLLIIPSVAIVVYSIIYQVYLRNYCVICLLTSGCVSLQVCVLENCFPLAFDCNACSINILIGLISICIAFFSKGLFIDFDLLHNIQKDSKGRTKMQNVLILYALVFSIYNIKLSRR